MIWFYVPALHWEGNNICDQFYLMENAVTTGVIIYWNPYQVFFIHRAHHVCCDEYNYRLSIEDMHSPCSSLLQQDPESHIYSSELLNLIP